MLLESIDDYVDNLWREMAEPADEAIRVNNGTSVTLTWATPRPIRTLLFHRASGRRGRGNPLPAARGIYVIYANGRPHYVGIAHTSSGLRGRFASRWDALRELGLNTQQLAGKCLLGKVYWATITRTGTRSSWGRISRSGRSGNRSIASAEGPLRVIELYLMHRLRTFGRGNRHREPLRFDSRRSISITNINPENMSAAIDQALGGAAGVRLTGGNASVF